MLVPEVRIRTLHAVLLCALMGLGSSARAQEGAFDAHGFALAAHDGGLTDGLLTQRPDPYQAGDLFAGGLFEYAKSPLVLVRDGERVPALDHLFALNVSAGVVAHERLRFDVALPLYLTSAGLDGAQGVDGGDALISAMVVLAGDERFSVGLVPQLSLPSGAMREYLGERTVSGGVLAAMRRSWEDLTVSAHTGFRRQPSVDLLNIGGADRWELALHGGYQVNRTTGLNLETRFRFPLSRNTVVGTDTPGELLASVRHRRPAGLYFSGGAAMALTPGVGAATFRLFSGLGYDLAAARELPADLDGDGIVNRQDDCPEEPEVVNGYADGDGCPDRLPTLYVDVRQGSWAVEGARVLVLDDDGPFENFESDGQERPLQVRPQAGYVVRASKGACLAGEASAGIGDADVHLAVELEPVRDGQLTVRVVDAEGAPIEGASVVDRAQAECAWTAPLSTDAEGQARGAAGSGPRKIAVEATGYLPAEIALPDLPVEEVVVVLESTQSTPTRVEIREGAIVLLEPVRFATGSAVLLPQSQPLLQEIADVINTRPRLGRVEIQGHTDSQGSDSYNLRLSQARADAVRKALLALTVPPERLLAKGYGERLPVATNRTSTGRAQNRRVAFVLIDRAEEGDAPLP